VLHCSAYRRRRWIQYGSKQEAELCELSTSPIAAYLSTHRIRLDKKINRDHKGYLYCCARRVTVQVAQHVPMLCPD
jgi:hypothetical protein